ncbi:MAG TPA: TlpA disulfide reductase family protein [Kofleriaceae bacterium]|nr:TlpA disulfide reductase family protein [Kofleriaceae bacterium]
MRALLVWCVLAVVETASAHPLVNRPAPAFAFANAVGGAPIRLGDHHGHVVVLEFWATWCGPCEITAEYLGKLQRKLGKAGVDVIGATNEERAVVKKYLDEHPPEYAIGLDVDDAATRSYVISGLPTIVLIDRTGTVREVLYGMPDDFDAFGAKVEQLAK